MNPLSRIAGRAVDAAMGLPGDAVPYSVRPDVGVPMPDGVVLLGDHYRPAGPGKPLPVVLIRSPYGRAGISGLVFAGPLARRGFQVFIQSTRGTFGSGGQFRPFLTEREDGLATVAWLRDQPWCDGQVSMTGASYLGHTQWAVAPYADPPLRSVSLHITAARITAAFYDHGAPGLLNGLNWTALIGRQERMGVLGLLPNPRQLARVRQALHKIPLQAADVDVAGAPVPFWRDFTGHAEPSDGFWAGADHDGADLTRLPPVSMVTGWWDLFATQQLKDYTAIRAAGGTARITVGPWLHGEPAEVKAIAQDDVEWLGHQLRGGPAPAGPPVRVFLQQAGHWLGFGEWPPQGTEAVAYYLRAGGGLSPGTGAAGTAGSGTAEPGTPEPGTPDMFVYDPADPTPAVGGPLLQPPGKQADNTATEARPDVLTYTSEPLAAALDLAGPVSARIFVRVCDVDEKGVSRNVVDGIRRLSPQTVPAADVQIGEDGVLEVAVELFPTAYRVQAGHRIRVQVSAGAWPRYARNFGSGEPFGAAATPLRCRFEIFRGGRCPAYVLLPVLPAPVSAAAQAAADKADPRQGA